MPIALVDKGRAVGAHQLSGAVVQPAPLLELFPDIPLSEMTSYGPVEREAVYLLTRSHAARLPLVPPPMHNKGNHVFSLARLARFMAEQAEALGVMVLPETDAQRLLVADGAVRGIRTGDKGRGRQGEELPTFEPGAELTARATVLADGVQGMLSAAAVEHFGLEAENPQIYALGVKEVWRVERPLDRVVHTLGWPLKRQARYREFGGTFAYPMGPDTLCLGLVVGLDYADASLSVHDLLQDVKQHPLFRKMLEGGERIAWGAKAIPEGGFWSLPASVSPPGAVILGDAAGFVNVPRLKGVHYALRSGMLAAETIYRALGERCRSGASGRALELRRAGAQLRDLPRPAPLPEHAPGLPARTHHRRRLGRRDGHAARRSAALAAGHAPRCRAAADRRRTDATASATGS